MIICFVKTEPMIKTRPNNPPTYTIKAIKTDQSRLRLNVLLMDEINPSSSIAVTSAKINVHEYGTMYNTTSKRTILQNHRKSIMPVSFLSLFECIANILKVGLLHTSMSTVKPRPPIINNKLITIFMTGSPTYFTKLSGSSPKPDS